MSNYIFHLIIHSCIIRDLSYATRICYKTSMFSWSVFTPMSVRWSRATNVYCYKFNILATQVLLFALEQCWSGVYWEVTKALTCPSYIFFTRAFQRNLPILFAFNFPTDGFLAQKYGCSSQQATLSRDFAQTSWNVCVLSYKSQGSYGSALYSLRIDARRQALPTSHTVELANVDHNHVEKNYLVFKLKM